ncbi:hypothetical protein LTS18_012916 [Coniosporium uncinatum]|uniref:Uncharacterized protein n=1 Tax=Coniosporium uncinatum TaxID=93489 RepID=A0ACC3D990_9PEZI|nr:hypothetical protein LTS18_012916 [Coniosporium uncinatum]
MNDQYSVDWVRGLDESTCRQQHPMRNQDLPAELLLNIFEHCSQFRDATALSHTSQAIRQIFQRNRPGIYLAVAPCSLQAYYMADALATAQKQKVLQANTTISTNPATRRDEHARLLQTNALIVSSAADKFERAIYKDWLNRRKISVRDAPLELSHTERSRFKGIVYRISTTSLLVAQEGRDQLFALLTSMSGIDFLQLIAVLEWILTCPASDAIQGINDQLCWSLFQLTKLDELSHQRQLVGKYYKQFRFVYDNSDSLEAFAILDRYQEELHLIADSLSEV